MVGRGDLLRISEAVSLGLHTMVLLASGGERRITNQAIAEVLGASVHHLAKVMQRLVRAELVDSAVGPRGGFKLAQPAENINLLDVYEAIEGPLGEPACLLGEPVCGGTDCLLGGLAQSVNREVRSYLTETTLAALAGRVAFAGLANKVGTSVSSDV